jgi:RND superfamily putative drug exporter
VAHFLFRLGRASAARPFIAIIVWAIALVSAGAAYLTLGGTLTDAFSIPGTETQRVSQEMSTEIDGLDGGSARVVFETQDGSPFTAEQQAQVSAALAAATSIEHVTGVVDPFQVQAQRDEAAQQLADARAQIELGRTQEGADQAQLDAAEAQLALGEQLAQNAAGLTTVSESGATALGIVSFDTEVHGVPQDSKDDVVAAIQAVPLDGVNAHFSAEFVSGPEGILGVGEIIGVFLALVVLLVMMRAVLPALLPIVTSVVGIGIGVATALAFSSVVDMQSITPVLGVMLGLAVGIDYSLFIVNRHRTQLKRGMAVNESVGLANGTAGNAVVFAGSTVLIALLALNVTGIPFMGVMGTVAAFCVFVAVLIAISLTPALLGLIGMRTLNKKVRSTAGAPEHAEAPIAPMRTGRAVVSLVATVLALGVLAIPQFAMRLGLPDGSQEPADSTQYQAYSITGAEFGEGINGPLLVTAKLPAAVSEAEVIAAQALVSNAVMAHDDVMAVVPVGVSADRDFLAFQVIPAEGPSSASTEALVHELRNSSPLDDGTVVGVAGEASGNIDISEKLADALPLYLLVVVGLSIIILVVVFRSLLVPIIATLGFVLSLFAAFGAVTAVFQWGWAGSLFGVHDPGPILSFLPIMLTGILFGLAMDYQLFLASGMREAYVHGMPARTAVVAGLRHGRAVVTAAAIIMISVFGGFVFSDIAMIRPMGFGLAMGVLLDAFVVRMVIMPAVLHLVGDGAWWLPRWLDRILPNVDVEGAALQREHPVAAA